MTDQTTTTTEVATITGPAADIATHTAAMTLAEKIEYAKLLADSGMIPEAYRKNPANCLVALEYGQALGIPGITALSQIVVVKGRPSMEAKLMITLARKAHHVVRLSGDDKQGTCTLILADDPSNPRTVTWTMETAKAHGLAGQGHWVKNPALMLQYRAASEAIRLHCPEVLAGVDYTPEEAREIAARNQSVAAATPVQVPHVAADPSRSVADYMARLGVKGAELRDFAARALGVEVASWAGLNKAQQRRVLDGLARWEQEGTDWTLAETVDAELVDPATGEVQ